MTGSVDAALTASFRADWGWLVAALIRMTGDWDLAEESAQEAYARAARAWPRAGVPAQPRAWLLTTARNRAVDRIRHRRMAASKLPELAAGTAPAAEEADIPDDRLRLIFTCCHPALAFEARVALALRTLCGLTTAEIARAFLASEQAMAKRLARAKHKIAAAGIPYRVPPAHLLPERTAAVLGVVYLLFNEGYAASAGADLLRPGLCAHAIDLARMTAELLPGDAEAGGLAALLLLLHARAAARVGADGALVPLEEQDRSRWDATMIEAGLTALRRSVRHEPLGPYQVQALIAACHATAPTAADTDWARIAGLYDELLTLLPSPAVRLNRAVAVAMRDGPAAGLALLDGLAGEGHPLLPAVRADLLRRAGQRAAAVEQYRAALAGTGNDAERRYLRRRLAECEKFLPGCPSGPAPLVIPGDNPSTER